ncbi:hypothetical protein HY572_04665 [Candidatus Micrarchaeota archaeon]|nr:hypothetical protein [Candidatus Micrarchaeota archaeon]
MLFILVSVQAVSIAPGVGSIPGNPDSILIAEVFPAYATTQANGVPIQTATINFTVQGRVLNASSTANEFQAGSVNVTARVESTNRSFSQVTTATGFNFNITLPHQESSSNNSLGYRVYVTTNTTNPAHNKTFNLFRSNVTNVTLAFVNSFPPFATGVNFTVNVSYFNGTTPVANGKPELRIFKVNGVQQAWTLTNLSDTTNAQGVIQYNVTIPADASGQYGLVVDRGAGFLVFGIRSAYTIAFRTENPSASRRSEFTTTQPINLVVAIRYSNGTPYNLAAADNAFALVTLPNASLVNVSLSVLNATSQPGVMNSTFTQTGLTGTYNVRVMVTVQGTLYETQGSFTVNPMRATLQAGAGFFREFGGKRIILPNSSVDFTILALNNSDDTLLQGSVNGGMNAVNCSRGNLTFVGFTNVVTGTNATNFSQLQAGQPQFGQVIFTPTVNVCSMRINVPSTTGVYRLDVNVTAPVSMGSQVVPASALVRVETIVLNLQPIQAAGGFDGGEFSFQLPPGENASFQLTAYNFSSGTQFPSGNLQNVTVLSISPMTFTGGIANPFNNFSANGTTTCRPCGAKPNPALPFYVTYPDAQNGRVTVTLPNTTGFFKVAVESNVSNEFVSGETFFEMKTVNGFAQPGSGAPGGGQQGGPSFGFGQASCSRGNVSFSANVFDVKTNQAAQGVRINSNLLMAMEESTGRNIANVVSVPIGNTTTSTGQATFNLSISQNLSAGFYFMLFNVTYQGRDDSIFGMLNCQEQGSRLVISQMPFGQFRPNVPLVLNYSQMFAIGSNGSFQRITNGTLTITRMRGFNNDVGGEFILAPNASQGLQRVNITAGTGTISLVPSNFSLAEWPQGFLMMEVNITNGSNPGPAFNQGPSWIVGGGHDSFAGGVQIRAYELFVSSQPPQNGIALGSNMSLLVNASTNVSESGSNFTVAFARFGRGPNTPAVIRSATRLIDGWNTSADIGYEQWNVTFAVPVTLKTGEAMVEITSNNSQGLQAKAQLFTFISGFTVQNLAQDDLFMEGVQCRAYDDASGNDVSGNGTFQGCVNPFQGGTFNYVNGSHMNLSLLNATYSIASRSNIVCLKRSFNFTRGGQGPMGTPVLFEQNGTIMAVIDNTTPGVYDTLVVNTSNGTQQIIFINNFTSQNRRIRGNTTSPFSDYYLSNIFQCAHLGLVNGSITPAQPGQQGYGGQGGEQSSGDNFVNDVFYVPYRIQYQNSPVVANVTHAGYVIKTGDGRPAGELAANLHTTTGSQTDVNGVGLVRVNITQSNRYQALWDVNTTVGGQNVSDRAKTFGDSSQFGGGQGTRIEIVAFRACRTFANVPAFAVGNENASFMCTVRDKSYNPIVGANLTVNLISGGYFGQSVTVARLYNATTGVIVPRLNSDTMDVNVLFTHPTGWPCNEGFRLEANVTNGTTTQLFDVGYAYRNCGYAGGP